MYKSKPAKNKRMRQKIADLRQLQFTVKIWHYGKRYVMGWYEKIRDKFGH